MERFPIGKCFTLLQHNLHLKHLFDPFYEIDFSQTNFSEEEAKTLSNLNIKYNRFLGSWWIPEDLRGFRDWEDVLWFAAQGIQGRGLGGYLPYSRMEWSSNFSKQFKFFGQCRMQIPDLLNKLSITSENIALWQDHVAICCSDLSFHPLRNDHSFTQYVLLCAVPPRPRTQMTRTKIRISLPSLFQPVD